MTTVQLDMFAARKARDEAIRRVSDHAGTEWLDAAKAALVSVAKSRAEFIADQIWETGLAKPSEARALGAVVRWALAEGVISDSGRYSKSAQPGLHCSPRKVWRSRMFDPGPALPLDDVNKY